MKSIKSFQLPLKATSSALNIFWIFGLVLNDNVPYEAEKAMAILAKEGIGTRPFYYPTHLQPVFNRMGLFLQEKHPVAERLAQRGFYIPTGLGLTLVQVQTVAKTLIHLFK